MTVAPELFDPEHALVALDQYQEILYGPLGIATLDPKDSDYRGEYFCSNIIQLKAHLDIQKDITIIPTMAGIDR